MTTTFNINIQLLPDAAQALAQVQLNLTLPLGALREQTPGLGEKIQLHGIPNSPWFVVAKRSWEIGQKQVTLTIWLGIPED